MQKILVARPIFPDVIERLKQHFEVDWNDGEVLSAEELTRRLADKDGALTAGDPVGAAVLAAAPRLRVVSNMAVGYNNFDMAAFNAANVLGTNTPDVLNESTADFGWALMMAAARRVTGAALIGLVNIVLLTAMATCGAFIYNLTTDLVGGIEVTLADRD